MENTNRTVSDLLDDFDKKLMMDANTDISDLPVEAEGPDRKAMESNPYAE